MATECLYVKLSVCKHRYKYYLKMSAARYAAFGVVLFASFSSLIDGEMFAESLVAADFSYSAKLEVKGIENNNVCGHLAIAAAAYYPDGSECLERIFQLLPSNGDQHTLDELHHVVRSLGFTSRALRWRKDFTSRFSGPAIIRIATSQADEFGHFIVILSHDNGNFLCLDAGNQIIWVRAESLWKSWDGVALHIAASESLLPPSSAHSWIKWFVSWVSMALGFFTILLCVASQTRVRVEKAISGRNRALLMTVSSVAVCLIALMSSRIYDGNYASKTSAVQSGLQAMPETQTLQITSHRDRGSESKVNFYYTIINNYDEEAVVGEISASCGCAVPTLSSKRIPPKGRIQITVAAKLQGPLEKQTFRVEVRFRKPVHPPVVMQGTIIGKAL